jgi:hypothetical protein
MKITIIITAILLLFSATGFAQTEPDKATTESYIKKIFNETEDYEDHLKEGAKYRITSWYGRAPHDLSFNYDNTTLSFTATAITDGMCSEGYAYRNISWAKLLNIEEDPATTNDSPVKMLKIRFLSNSVIRTGYTNDNCDFSGFSFYGREENVSTILFPYRNEPGVRERLIKALNHLSKLEKEEQAANDPFGN